MRARPDFFPVICLLIFAGFVLSQPALALTPLNEGVNDLGLLHYTETPKTWTFNLDGTEKVEIGVYNSARAEPGRYGGWNAYLSINGDKIWRHTGDSTIYDYLMGKTVSESAYRNQYYDLSSEFHAGTNTVTYYHYTGDGDHGLKIRLTKGAVASVTPKPMPAVSTPAGTIAPSDSPPGDSGLLLVLAVIFLILIAAGIGFFYNRAKRAPATGRSATVPDLTIRQEPSEGPVPGPGNQYVPVPVSKMAEPEPETSTRNLKESKKIVRPLLSLTLDQTRLAADKWHKVGIQIKNTGDTCASDITFRFSDEFETRWIKPTTIDAGDTKNLEIGILPKKEGNIPLEIALDYRDTDKNAYRQTQEFWIDVSDRPAPDPGKDAGITPVSEILQKQAAGPVTLKQLPPELSDRYTESEFIGKGGFARVFKAKRKDGQYVAVKIPISLDESTGKSFIAELQNWTRLDHPNIVRVYNFNIMPCPYFEMELCDSSLAERKKPIDSEEAAWILFNICEGLKFSHANKIIHRDLKPQNILLKNGVPKISDWGLSRVISESSSSTVTSFTPYYAAPEQISGRHKDERTDIWQLGVILYELVTGVLPFTGESVIEIGMNIATKEPGRPSEIAGNAKPIEPVILKCLRKDPAERYPSVLELQKALGLYLRLNYAESLKMSVTARDFKKSAYYCGDLVLINLVTGDIASAYTFLSDLAQYAEGDVKAEILELSGQLKNRMDNSISEVPDELVKNAEFIVHKVSLGFRNV